MTKLMLRLALLALTACEVDRDGDGQPPGIGVGLDCDDDDPNIFYGAPDARGDGIDWDCGASPDIDSDDWPDDSDCDPQNRDIFPCSPMEVEGDGVDHDCDGQDGVREAACPP